MLKMKLKHLKQIKHIIAVLILSSMAGLAFAEDAAPVYDADNFPPQFDGQADGAAAAPVVSPQPQQQPRFQSQSQSLSNDASSVSSSLTQEQRIARAERQINNLQHKEASSKIDALQTEVQSLRGQVEQLTHQLQLAQNQQKIQYADLDKRISSKSIAIKTPSPDTTTTTTTTTTDDAASASATKQTDVQALRNEVGQLKQQVQQTKKQQKLSSVGTPDDTIPQNSQNASVATKSKQKNAEPKIKAGNTIDAAVAPDQPNVAEEQQIYQTAYDLIKAKKYNEAISALQRMLQKYPSGQFAANAHYWLGELYGLLGKNDQSAVEFGAVVRNYPDSPKVSDAQLKLGLIYAAQFKWPDAKVVFKKVITHYPGTASARLAAEQLKQLKEAGH